MFLEQHYVMWLARIDGISLKKKYDIINYFKSAKAFFEADSVSIKDYCKKYKINLKNVLDVKSDDILNKYLNELYKKDIKYIAYNDTTYPRLLKNIPDAPLGFYMIGNMPQENKNKVSIIGARKCTQYGAMNSYKFSKELSEKGIVIVSGMALGIDAMAHKGSIDGSGQTVAVLGCGVDVVYPPSNRNLRDNIIKDGCVISEYPPSTPPYPAHFPSRNRIISGLSDALIVVESAEKSGTLITVGQALEQGRDIFAIPGNINNKMSYGTNNLIKDCAFPLTHIDDILSVLGVLHKFHKNNKKEQNIIKSNKNNNIENIIEPDEKTIYSYIDDAITIDEIVLKTNFNVQKVQYALTMLEIKGYVQKLAGQKYIKKL